MTPEEFSKRMDLLADSLPNAVDKAMRFAVEESQTIIQERVFNDNKQVDGSSLGQYKSDSYKKWRESKGLQVKVRDLQVNGDLMRSIKANTSIDNYSLEFSGIHNTEKFSLVSPKPRKKPKATAKRNPTLTNAELGFGLETLLFGKRRTIFYLNQEDIKNIKEQVNDIYTNEVNAILGTR